MDTSLNLTECALKNRRDTEAFFVLSNHIAASVLLITLLFASALYICVSLPNASESRPDELEAVVARFSGEFVALQVSFIMILHRK